MMNDLGTLRWARETGGAIDIDDEALLASQIGYVLEQAALPPTSPSWNFEPEDLQPPISALTKDATVMWNDHAQRWLGHRTWCFAAILNQLWGLEADLELLYCATLLHDLGLTAHFGPTQKQPCFAVTGAAAARPVVANHRSEDAADDVAEAIAMHLNLRIEHTGALQQLVSAATLIDVTGLRMQLIPPKLIHSVNALHPRFDFGASVGEVLATHAHDHPATRCGWLQRMLNIKELTRQHPLDLTDRS